MYHPDVESRDGRRPFRALVMLAAIMTLQGCAGFDPVQTHRDWSGRRDGLRAILVMPAKIRMYAVRPDKRREEIAEWSAKASEHVTSSVVAQLQRRGGPSVGRLTEGTVPAELAPKFRETQTQYERVNAQIIEDLYQPSSKSAPKSGGARPGPR